jgi:hypothetical protein
LGLEVQMNGEMVADITLNAIDQTGKQIKFIFCKVAETYAIYSNEDRIVVQYADDPKKADEQRRTVAFLAPLRGEINGLIEDWRDHRWAIYRAKAQRYDRRTADALLVALQGDGEMATKLLEAVRSDILEERRSLGRLYYVGWAFLAGLGVVIASWLLAWLVAATGVAAGLAKVSGINPVLSSSIGYLGALFSIAITIRGRAVQTDLRLRDNVLDAVLRMLIGAISAFVLLLLFQSRIVIVSLGGLSDIGKADSGAVSAAEIIIAFLAGFSERLVGNLLDDKNLLGRIKIGEAAVDEAPDARRTPADKTPKPDAKPADPGKAPGTGDQTVGGDADESVDDRSITDVEIDDIDVTSDADLPPATGGIDRPAA